MTFSPAGTRSASAALVSPMRGRRSNTSTSPSRPPSTSTVPSVGNVIVAATCSSVVLPAPLGPITIQRSSSCASQSTLRNSRDASRRTDTPRSLSTSSDTCCPFQGPRPEARSPAADPPHATLIEGTHQALPGLPVRGGGRAAGSVLHAMNHPRTTLLITLTGRDRPGVTSRLFGELGRFPLSVIDIEQVVLRGRLVLG